MTLFRLAALLPLTIVSLTAGAGRQAIPAGDDPKLRAVVERFFATQEAEDVDGYLALWSASAERPRPDQLRFVFESGDDKFSGVAIGRVFPAADRVRVRVSATRDRVMPPRTPGGNPISMHTKMAWSLTLVREGEDWKIVREGPAADGLAETLVATSTAEARERLLAAESDLVNDGLIAALSRRGGQAAVLQDHAAAQVAFERAVDVARRVGNQRLEGEALQNLANAMYFQRNLQGALETYEQRLALERGRADDDGIASSLLGVAVVRYTLAEYGAALAAYREALALQEKSGDEGVIATTLISTGNVLYLQGEFTSAIADYTRSRDINKRLRNNTGEMLALRGMGRVFQAQGDYAAALDVFASVLADAVSRANGNDQGDALMSIGDVHFRLANLDAARAALIESRTHFEALKDAGRVGRAWQALALTELAAGRFAASEEGYRKSSASCAAIGDAECVASATVGLAFAQTAQDKFTEGIASYKKAVQAFTALKRREEAARSEIGLAQALSGNKEYRASADAAGHARQEADALANDDVLWRARVAEAAALRHLKEAKQALASAQTAVAAVDRLIEAARVRPSAPVARDTSSAFALIALLYAESGDAAAAFESAERMRAHDLRVTLAPAERAISRGMTDVEREEERAIAVELVSLHAQLSREKRLPKPDAQRIARLEASTAQAAERRTAQQQRLFDRLPELQTWRGIVKPASRDDVGGLLPDAASALVEFVVGDDELLTIVARRGGQGVEFTTGVAKLPRKALADRVAKLVQVETLRDAPAWSRVSRAFMAAVTGLPEAFKGTRRAIVVPHEILWRVPFDALPAAEGQVVDRTALVYASSVTALVRSPKRTDTAPPADALVIAAGPEIAPRVVERIAQTAPGWTLRAPASAEQEAKRLAGDADPERTVVITGSAATESTLRQRMPSATVLQIAAPFRVNSASPLFSPILLATSPPSSPPTGQTGDKPAPPADPDPADDGALETREVMNLNLQARVIVLSDGAALAMRDAADEAGTIAWAWRAAGIPSVVMPRWRADESDADAASLEFMRELHRRLRAGDPPDAAMQSARATLRARPTLSAPFYWAGWILIGGQ
jgi:tetratricopeptide (TPR) repeat protein